MYLDWFRTLPLFVEMPGFRAVHACWDQNLINKIKAKYGDKPFSSEFVVESSIHNSFAGVCIDRLTCGTDMRLPPGMIISGRDGYKRDRFRTKFWSVNPKTYGDLVFQPDPLPEDIANKALSEEELARVIFYPADDIPVFVGHYWLQGRPRPIKPNVACLDYSAVKYGRLTAYRYDGERVLDESKYVWVYVDPNNKLQDSESE